MIHRFGLALHLEGLLDFHQKTLQMQRKTETDGEKVSWIPSKLDLMIIMTSLQYIIQPCRRLMHTQHHTQIYSNDTVCEAKPRLAYVVYLGYS